MSEEYQKQQEELAQKTQDLQNKKIPPEKLYSVIWQLGKAEYQPARSVIERFLTDADDEIRIAALQVLVIRFAARDHVYWEMARDLLTDGFSGNRVDGASLLEVLKRNTQDEKTLRLLASMVGNTKEKATVRCSAYAAMRGIIHFDPFEIGNIIRPHFNLEQEIDWELVNRYRSQA